MSKRIARRHAVVAIVLVSSGVLTGCSHSAGGGADLEREFDKRASEAIADATEGGAGSQQVEILERAATDGGVTFEDAKIAATSAMACMASQGVTANYEEKALANGVTIPAYTVQDHKSDGGDAVEVVDQCEISESFWVNMLYQMQPTSIEANFAFIEKQAPVIRQCLEDAGYDTDPKATGMDLVRQSAEVSTGSFDCALDAGVTGY